MTSEIGHGRTAQRTPEATFLLETERLHLRPCGVEDVDLLQELWTEPEVRRFLFDDRQPSLEQARSFVDDSLANFEQHGYGLWLVFERKTDLLAGFSGLLGRSPGPPSLIFGTRPARWGRGYATEGASAVLRYAADVLRVGRLVADVDEPNEASIRVLEKLGMTRTRRTIVNGRPLLYYETGT